MCVMVKSMDVFKLTTNDAGKLNPGLGYTGTGICNMYTESTSSYIHRQAGKSNGT